MVAQIRTGLWVRNGFAIRGQLLHYRDFMLRELCYDQDLFMMQIALSLLDTNTVLVAILDRFNLLEYFSGQALHSTYEGPQLAGMVEEVLYVFITMLSESANITKMPIEEQVRREVVHALALGPCSYTDLIKRVAERLVEDVCFESVLRQIAHFKPPDSISDIGFYELNDDGFDEVNPFFYHYARNKREEVEGILAARLKKKGNVDPVIVPKRVEIPAGSPFDNIISTAFESEVLLQVLFYALFNAFLTIEEKQEPDSAEAILDQVVHLAMLAIVHRNDVFSKLSVTKTFEGDRVLADLFCRLEWHEKYGKTYQTRVAWILDQMATVVPEEILKRRKTLGDNEKAAGVADAKKRAAKARQEAIMTKMKAQQASFASFNFEDEDDEDEDEDMEGEANAVLSYGTCIVCQEDLDASRSFGMLGMVQPSRQVRKQPDGSSIHLNEVLAAPESMDRGDEVLHQTFQHVFPPPHAELLDDEAAQSLNSGHLDGFPPGHTRFGLHASACSHMMHLDCFQNYSASVRQRHRAQATRNHPEVIPRKEYICPLCKSLGNVIFPIPLSSPTEVKLSETPFPDWIRGAGISILKSRTDPLLESLQFRNGTGEFVFWSAQDSAYPAILKGSGAENIEVNKMVDTVLAISKSISQQSRHLRDRYEPETGERGAGIYLPEELVGYTIAAIESSQRGVDLKTSQLLVDNLTEAQTKMIRGLVACLTRLSALHFKSRSDEGREAVRQAIIKRLLPEWSRGSLTSFSYPLLLRDPFTLLVETAAIAPEMLRHVLILTYYACLARTVIGLVSVVIVGRLIWRGERDREDNISQALA
jgi:E3 ubiquitin-protein ligase UBR1